MTDKTYFNLVYGFCFEQGIYESFELAIMDAGEEDCGCEVLWIDSEFPAKGIVCVSSSRTPILEVAKHKVYTADLESSTAEWDTALAEFCAKYNLPAYPGKWITYDEREAAGY